MRHFDPILALAVFVIAALAALAGGDAHAATTGRVFIANATSFCQTALPVFDGNVRKRPLAVQNEGSGDAFVTCSFTGQVVELDSAVLVVVNNGGSDAQLACTGVTYINTAQNQYATKTVTVPASGNAIAVMSWSGADFAGAPDTIPGLGVFNVSCKLAPGLGIGYAFVSFQEDIGA